MPTERWEPIKGNGVGDFSSRYEVSSWGRVRNLQTRKYMKVFLATDMQRNPSVSLTLNGKAHNCSLAKLVAHTFLGPPPQGTRLAFKDRDRANCHKTNLYYMPYEAKKIQLTGERPPMTLSQATQKIWEELIPDTQDLLKQYDLMAMEKLTNTHGEFGLNSRHMASMPEGESNLGNEELTQPE